jgi:hypothetical protein
VVSARKELTLPATGATSRPINIWPDSAAQSAPRARTATSEPTALMLKPVIGKSSGKRVLSWRSDETILHVGMLAC